MNKKIAITGGIGSGKSLALSIISSLGYNTISLDEEYKKLCLNSDFVLEICNLLNVQPLNNNGVLSIDKEKISNIVFNDREKLNKLNNFTHKKIFESAFKKNNQAINFYEVPLLFEGNYQNLFDKVLVIKRDKSISIESACKRDNCDVERVIEKSKNQVDYDNIDLSLHTIIYNNGDKDLLKQNLIKAIGELEK